MVDCVLTPHPNELTCGTGKWSVRLAERLGVPCQDLNASACYAFPLVSARMTELTGDVWLEGLTLRQFDLVVHDYCAGWESLIRGARRAYAANPDIAAQVRPIRADVQTIFCPSSLKGTPDRGSYRVLTYGMAHKFTAPYYEKLKILLEKAHPGYTVSLSTAVHEGSPWDESLQAAAHLLRGIFVDRLRVLGYLADDALARELAVCDAVALFYSPGLRANNTTAWAALDAGKPLVTNPDEYTPKELCGRVMNICSMQHWPFGHMLHEFGVRGQEAAQAMSWDKLLGILRA